MNPITRGALVDMVAIGAITSLAIFAKLDPTHALGAIVIVVVGRLRPASDSVQSSRETIPEIVKGSGVLSIVYSVARMLGKVLCLRFPILLPGIRLTLG